MSQYLKPDSELGYVEDHAMIEFLQFNNLRHSILGCMLGDFNEVGNYVVSQEIVEELISMEKYVVQTYDNIELCRSVLKLDKQISFMVTFEGNRATLSLVEKLNYEANFKLNSGTYSNINEFVLDSVETSGEINRSVIYDRWNIKLIPGEIVDIFNCDDSILEKYFGILNRFKYLLEANKILLEKEEKLEEVEASYSNELLDILKHYPKLEKAVMQTVKETLEEKKNAVSVKKPFFAKTFNEVLENAIEKNITVLEETEQKEFIQEKRNAVVNVNIKRENVLDVEKVEVIEEKNEIVPKIPQLKMQPSYESKPIQELGVNLVSANKQVTERLTSEKEEIESDLIRRTIVAVGEKKGVEVVLPKKTEESKQENKQPEKEKLIATLVGAGMGAIVGGAGGAVVGAVAGTVVAGVVKEVKVDQKQNAKKTISPSGAKGKDVKKDGGKKSSGGKGSGSKGKGDKAKAKDNKSKATEKKEIRVGIYSSPSMVDSEFQETVKKETDGPRLKLKRTEEKEVELYNDGKEADDLNAERSLLGDIKKELGSLHEKINQDNEEFIDQTVDVARFMSENGLDLAGLSTKTQINPIDTGKVKQNIEISEVIIEGVEIIEDHTI